jgi:hypothetical protein
MQTNSRNPVSKARPNVQAFLAFTTLRNWFEGISSLRRSAVLETCE